MKDGKNDTDRGNDRNLGLMPEAICYRHFVAGELRCNIIS